MPTWRSETLLLTAPEPLGAQKHRYLPLRSHWALERAARARPLGHPPIRSDHVHKRAVPAGQEGRISGALALVGFYPLIKAAGDPGQFARVGVARCSITLPARIMQCLGKRHPDRLQMAAKGSQGSWC